MRRKGPTDTPTYGADGTTSGPLATDPGWRESEQATISARGLVRSFNGVDAVDGLNLEISKGEIYGFLGPNGAGKTTTVRVLCTLLSPTAGEAIVAGYDVAREPEKVRLHIGVALQEAALDPKQTGKELLRLQGRLYGLSRTEIERRLVDLEQLIDMTDQHLFRWDEAPPRSRRGARAQSRGPLPRRADDGSRSGQPYAHLG